MQKNNNRLMQKVCSVIIVLAMAFNNAGTVFAQEAASPESLPSSTASSDSTQTTIPESTPSKEPSSDTANSDTASSTPSSEPSDTASSDTTSEPSSDSTPSSEPASEPNSGSSNSESVSEPDSEPVFEELKIDSFTQEAEMLENGQAQVSVGLSRDDVSVNYQWQSLAQEKEQKTPELLFDYSSYSDKSYYFPYVDITEEELLAQNPGATWAGIEMYLDMKAKAAKQRSALPVEIENGTPNYILEQIENGGAALANEATCL